MIQTVQSFKGTYFHSEIFVVIQLVIWAYPSVARTLHPLRRSPERYSPLWKGRAYKTEWVGLPKDDGFNTTILERFLHIPVVPGQAGGGSFQKEKNYIAQKEFAYRMCARRPTSAMPKSFLCCERAFCPSMVVMFCALKWSVLMSWCLLRGQVMWWSRHLMRCNGLCCVTWCNAMSWWWAVLLQYYSVLQSTTPILLRTTNTTLYYSSTTLYNKVLLKYYSVLLQYYLVLQSTTPVLTSITKYYSNTTLYYKVLLQYYPVLQRTTPILLCTTKYYSNTTLYYKD